MDFRTAAAEETLRKADDSSASALERLGESGCVPVAGGRRALVFQAVAFNIVTLLGLLATFAVAVLSFTGFLPRGRALPLLLLLFLVSLFTRGLKSLLLKSYLARRPDGWLGLLPQLQTQPVGLEDAATYKKLKFVTEDQGICLLDPERHRFLVEGCTYRYVVYARDIISVEPVSQFALSGARLHCRMADQSLELVLTASGPGPLASLLQAFDPGAGARSLALVLNRTLFGVETPSFTQRALPPPLPRV